MLKWSRYPDNLSTQFMNVPKDYNYDSCVQNSKDEKSLNKLGCSSVFGNMEKVCTDTEKAKKAMEILNEDIICQYPCTYLDISLTKMEISDAGFNSSSSVCLKFRKFVSVTESHYSYTELELLAEVGGYVGLFLGFSIYECLKFF